METTHDESLAPLAAYVRLVRRCELAAGGLLIAAAALGVLLLDLGPRASAAPDRAAALGFWLATLFAPAGVLLFLAGLSLYAPDGWRWAGHVAMGGLCLGALAWPG
jgi:hypothetical protein